MTVPSIASQMIRTVRASRAARAWLAMVPVALGVLAAGHAQADVPGRPQPRVIHLLTTLEGEGATTTPSGPPDHGFFRVVNPGRTRATVSIESLVLLGAEGNTRLTVTRVMANNHPANPSSISVPGHATVHLMVFFSDLPAGRVPDQRFVVRLTARVAGTAQRADSVITRAMPRRPGR